MNCQEQRAVDSQKWRECCVNSLEAVFLSPSEVEQLVIDTSPLPGFPEEAGERERERQ